MEYDLSTDKVEIEINWLFQELVILVVDYLKINLWCGIGGYKAYYIFI